MSALTGYLSHFFPPAVKSESSDHALYPPSCHIEYGQIKKRVALIAAATFGIFRAALAMSSIPLTMITASIGLAWAVTMGIRLYFIEETRAKKIQEELVIRELKNNRICYELHINPLLAEKALKAASETILPITKANWIFAPGPDSLLYLTIRWAKEFSDIESLVLKSVLPQEFFEIIKHLLSLDKEKRKPPEHFIQRYTFQTGFHYPFKTLSKEQQEDLFLSCKSVKTLQHFIFTGLSLNTQTEKQTPLTKMIAWLNEKPLDKDEEKYAISIISYLCEQGADPNMLIDGKKPSDLCQNQALKEHLLALEKQHDAK